MNDTVSFIVKNSTLFMSLFLICICYFVDRFQKKNIWHITATISIILICTWFFRDSNIDYNQYVYYFDSLKKGNSLFDLFYYEIGFSLISILFSFTWLDAKQFYMLLLVIIICIYCFVFYKDKKFTYLYLSYYLSSYYILYEQVLIRQGIATALLLLCVYLYSESSRRYYLFFIPPLFHSASIIGFLFFIFDKVSNKKVYSFLVVCMFIFGFWIGIDPIFNFILRFIDSEKIMSYSLSIYNQPLSLDSMKNIKLLIISCCIFFLWDDMRKDKFLFNMSKFYLIGVMISFLFSEFYIFSIRLSQIFLVSEIIIVPKILEMLKIKYWKEICFIFCILNLLNMVIV